MKETESALNKSVQPVPQMPSCLIPMEDSQKGDNPICNNKGELVGNYFDFIINAGCITDSAIVLEFGDNALLNAAQQGLQELVDVELSGYRCDDAPLPFDDEADDDNLPMEVGEEDGNNRSENCVGAEGEQGTNSNTSQEQEHQKRYARSREKRKKRVTFFQPVSRPANDPWALLDPHSKGKSVEKPPQKKLPYKIPKGLDDNTTKKRKRKTEIKKELLPINEVVDKVFSNRSSFPKNPMKVPDFPEFDNIFWKEFKVREKIKKEEVKMLKKEEQLEEMSLVAEEEDQAAENPREEFDNGDDNFDDDNIPMLQVDNDAFGPNLDFQRRTLGSDISLMSGDLTLSYEELVRQHVEKFLASASEYAQLTDLSRKVSEWEEKIKPRLEEEELHGAFDIHEYGSSVIKDLVRGEWKFFKDIMKDKPEFEICRYLLSTLQLANVYNVELLVTPDSSNSIMDRLQVKLLSTKRHFEELEDFLAPSVKET